MDNAEHKKQELRPYNPDAAQDVIIASHEKRLTALEEHFDYGGRIWALEGTKKFLTGLGCVFTGFGAFLWYLIDLVIEALKK